MRALLIVESIPLADSGSCLATAAPGIQIDLFVFGFPREAFDEDVVAPCPFTIHADLDFGVFQRLYEVDGCELAALVGIHDLGLAEPAMASSRASRHGPVSNVIDSRQARTLRVNQSMTAVR
jgi:hypothetical protein